MQSQISSLSKTKLNFYRIFHSTVDPLLNVKPPRWPLIPDSGAPNKADTFISQVKFEPELGKWGARNRPDTTCLPNNNADDPHFFPFTVASRVTGRCKILENPPWMVWHFHIFYASLTLRWRIDNCFLQKLSFIRLLGIFNFIVFFSMLISLEIQILDLPTLLKRTLLFEEVFTTFKPIFRNPIMSSLLFCVINVIFVFGFPQNGFPFFFTTCFYSNEEKVCSQDFMTVYRGVNIFYRSKLHNNAVIFIRIVKRKGKHRSLGSKEFTYKITEPNYPTNTHLRRELSVPGKSHVPQFVTEITIFLSGLISLTLLSSNNGNKKSK